MAAMTGGKMLDVAILSTLPETLVYNKILKKKFLLMLYVLKTEGGVETW